MKRLLILNGMLLIALLVSGCGEGSQAAGQSPLEVVVEESTATLTPDERAKIRKDLLEVVEWDETHPGEGQEVAPDYFEFDQGGRIRCFISFDPDQIIVTSAKPQGLPIEDQPGGQIITRHGGQVVLALEYYNSMTALMPLESIKGLAQEESVIGQIIPIREGEQKTLAGANQVNLTPTPVPPKIDPELLEVVEWEEDHPGEGRKVAPVDFLFGANGWIDCIVRFDPDKIVVKSGHSIKEQLGGQLIIRHGGQVIDGIGLTNSVGALMPLESIKELAQEDAVISIIPNRIVEPID